MVAVLCLSCLLAGAALGLMISCLLAAAVREDECSHCLSRTMTALGDVNGLPSKKQDG